MNKLKWCFKIRNGLKIVEPSEDISGSYIRYAEKTLSKINDLIDEEDFLWVSIRIYYCAYYSLYSFLQKIGIKSGNHDCSIELVKELIKEDFIGDISLFRQDRIDAQYYLQINQKKNLLNNYKKVKFFYLKFKEIVDSLNKDKAEKFITQTRKLKGINDEN